MFELILVSQSPRRREILESAGISFRVDTVKVSEFIEKNLNWPTAVAELARLKAEAYLAAHNYLKNKDILLFSADTMVILQDEALGKPKDAGQAMDFLRRLSGKTHSVITGFCLINLRTDETIVQSEMTLVSFRSLTEDEISQYVSSGEPMDKAGAYAIQGGGRNFVDKYVGSYTNVVGLPLEKLEAVLAEKKWHVRRKSI